MQREAAEPGMFHVKRCSEGLFNRWRGETDGNCDLGTVFLLLHGGAHACLLQNVSCVADGVIKQANIADRALEQRLFVGCSEGGRDFCLGRLMQGLRGRLLGVRDGRNVDGVRCFARGVAVARDFVQNAVNLAFGGADVELSQRNLRQNVSAQPRIGDLEQCACVTLGQTRAENGFALAAGQFQQA